MGIQGTKDHIIQHSSINKTGEFGDINIVPGERGNKDVDKPIKPAGHLVSLVVRMDDMRRIFAVMTLSAVVLAFAAPALAQVRDTPMASPMMMPGRTQGGTMVPVERSDKDIMAAMMDTKDIGMASALMKTAGLEGMAKPEGKYTLFVASDNALATSPDLANKMTDKVKDRQTGMDFVKGHMVSGMVMPDEMTDGKKLTLMNGKTMTVSVKDGKMTVDNANIVKAVKANNGVVYVMDRIPSSIWTMLADMGLVPMVAMPVVR